MRIRPRSPYGGLTPPSRQPPTRSANRIASLISDRLLHVSFRRIFDVSNYFYGNDETKFSKKVHVVPKGRVIRLPDRT
jgi:hypothetical protein